MAGCVWALFRYPITHLVSTAAYHLEQRCYGHHPRCRGSNPQLPLSFQHFSSSGLIGHWHRRLPRNLDQSHVATQFHLGLLKTLPFPAMPFVCFICYYTDRRSHVNSHGQINATPSEHVPYWGNKFSLFQSYQIPNLLCHALMIDLLQRKSYPLELTWCFILQF